VPVSLRYSDGTSSRVETVLLELYAASASMHCVQRPDGSVEMGIRIPHEVG